MPLDGPTANAKALELVERELQINRAKARVLLERLLLLLATSRSIHDAQCTRDFRELYSLDPGAAAPVWVELRDRGHCDSEITAVLNAEAPPAPAPIAPPEFPDMGRKKPLPTF